MRIVDLIEKKKQKNVLYSTRFFVYSEAFDEYTFRLDLLFLDFVHGI